MLFTIHHAAATGGSIISQVIAAATNSVLISEINPYGSIQRSKPHYDPTSILWHLTYNSEEINSNLKLKYFLCQLDISIIHVNNLSKNLLLRDHTHTTFNFLNKEVNFFDKQIDSLFIESLKYFYEIKDFKINFPRAKPILSIRHPLDSYLSSRRQNLWLEAYCGSNINIDNYCKSLIKLQKTMKDKEYAQIIRYEDVCNNMRESITSLLDKMNIDHFIPSIEEINRIKVTGKSGRQSNSLTQRKRRIDDIDSELINDVKTSKYYHEYCTINNYNLNYKDSAIN